MTQTDLRPQLNAINEIAEGMAANAGLAGTWIIYLLAACGAAIFLFTLVMVIRSIPPIKPKPKPVPVKREVKAQPWNTRGWTPQAAEERIVIPTFENAFLIAVQNASKTRKWETTGRAIMKLFEEGGELSEAYLGATTRTGNYKSKTPQDVREEAVDASILALHIALTRLPGEEHLTDAEIVERVMLVQTTKLKKRAAQVAAQGDN